MLIRKDGKHDITPDRKTVGYSAISVPDIARWERENEATAVSGRIAAVGITL
jgi:hypothetical protein